MKFKYTNINKKHTINISRLRIVIKKKGIIEKFINNYSVKHSSGIECDIYRICYRM